jgi:hypothetical protein
MEEGDIVARQSVKGRPEMALPHFVGHQAARLLRVGWPLLCPGGGCHGLPAAPVVPGSAPGPLPAPRSPRTSASPGRIPRAAPPPRRPASSSAPRPRARKPAPAWPCRLVSRLALLRSSGCGVRSAAPPPRVRSIDDLAWRRGRTDAPIFVDLETHRPLDVLEGREAAPVARWRAAQSRIAVIVRERAETSADAAKGHRRCHRWRIGFTDGRLRTPRWMNCSTVGGACPLRPVIHRLTR